jgi:UDP-glucose 4-epimerase
MRVVIVGASGNVGTALLRRLAIEADIEVTAVARRMPPSGKAPYDSATWHTCDIGEPHARPRLATVFRGADAVVHLGWLIQPSHDSGALHRVNVTGSHAVIDAVTDAEVPALVYASSVGAYAPAPKDREVDEDWPTTGVPGSSYSRYKSTVETLLNTVDSQVRVVRLRPALTFQRDVGSELARYFLGPFVPTRWLRYGRVPLVPSHPRLRLQAVHADDVAEAYLRALRTDVRGAFNIAAEPALTPELIAEQFRGRAVPVPTGVLTVAAAVTWLARLQPIDRGWVDLALNAPLMSTRRAREELGWRPSIGAVAALRELIDGLADGAHTASPPLSANPLLPGRLGGLLRGRLPGTGNPY